MAGACGVGGGYAGGLDLAQLRLGLTPGESGVGILSQVCVNNVWPCLYLT